MGVKDGEEVGDIDGTAEEVSTSDWFRVGVWVTLPPGNPVDVGGVCDLNDVAGVFVGVIVEVGVDVTVANVGLG